MSLVRIAMGCEAIRGEQSGVRGSTTDVWDVWLLLKIGVEAFNELKRNINNRLNGGFYGMC